MGRGIVTRIAELAVLWKNGLRLSIDSPARIRSCRSALRSRNSPTNSATHWMSWKRILTSVWTMKLPLGCVIFSFAESSKRKTPDLRVRLKKKRYSPETAVYGFHVPVSGSFTPVRCSLCIESIWHGILNAAALSRQISGVQPDESIQKVRVAEF